MKFLSHSEDDFDLLLHILKNSAKEKANFIKMRNRECEDIIEVEIPLAQFNLEVKDVPAATVSRFLKSAAFKRQYVVENEVIKTKVI